MGLAWFIHGLLLEQMSRDFVEGRLKDEVAFLEHQLTRTGADLTKLDTGTYFEDVFHHAFAIAIDGQSQVSPEKWQPLLEALLDENAQARSWLGRQRQSMLRANCWLTAEPRS